MCGDTVLADHNQEVPPHWPKLTTHKGRILIDSGLRTVFRVCFEVRLPLRTVDQRNHHRMVKYFGYMTTESICP